jgi:hypothetical protein
VTQPDELDPARTARRLPGSPRRRTAPRFPSHHRHAPHQHAPHQRTEPQDGPHAGDHPLRYPPQLWPRLPGEEELDGPARSGFDDVLASRPGPTAPVGATRAARAATRWPELPDDGWRGADRHGEEHKAHEAPKAYEAAVAHTDRLERELRGARWNA